MTTERKSIFLLNILLGLIVVTMRDLVPEPITVVSGFATGVFALWNLTKVKS